MRRVYASHVRLAGRQQKPYKGLFNQWYCDTELKRTMKKSIFFPRAIDCKAPLPFDQAWSRASKKVGPLQSIASNAEKSHARGAENGPFCMGILVTLSLSKIKAPIGRKKDFC